MSLLPIGDVPSAVDFASVSGFGMTVNPAPLAFDIVENTLASYSSSSGCEMPTQGKAQVKIHTSGYYTISGSIGCYSSAGGIFHARLYKTDYLGQGDAISPDIKIKLGADSANDATTQTIAYLHDGDMASLIVRADMTPVEWYGWFFTVQKVP